MAPPNDPPAADAAPEAKEPEGTFSKDQAPLDADQIALVHQLLDSLETEDEKAYCDYRCARRYLRARGWSLDKALKSLKDTVQWRKEFGVDELVRDHMETLKRQGASGKNMVWGKDREGHPVINMHSVREKLYHHDDSMRLLVYTLERAIREMDTENTGVERVCLAIDMCGFSVRNAPPLKTSKMTVHILQNYYVERLHKAFIYEPGWAFSTFWSVIKVFIDPVTKSKVHLVKGSAEQKTEQMTEHIDRDQLLTEFGGTNESPFQREAMDEYWREDELRHIQEREAFDGVEERDEADQQ